MKRIFAAAAVVLGLVGTPGAAMASPRVAVAAPVPGATTVTINGHTYGPKDGLKVQTYDVTLPSGANSPGGLMSPLSTAAPFYIYWGTSGVTSTENFQYYYSGTSYAAGNVLNNVRYIQVCFSYTRDGANLSGNICSNADSSSGRWLPGTKMYKSVTDTLYPNAPRTQFHYSTVTINPKIV